LALGLLGTNPLLGHATLAGLLLLCGAGGHRLTEDNCGDEDSPLFPCKDVVTEPAGGRF
jgi:hypothetical protein